METSTTVIMVLTNLIMLAGGYYLGVSRERERASRVVGKLVSIIGLDVACKIFEPERKTKKGKK